MHAEWILNVHSVVLLIMLVLGIWLGSGLVSCTRMLDADVVDFPSDGKLCPKTILIKVDG